MERGRTLWPLTGQGRRFFLSHDEEGTVRYHANDHPLGAGLSTRYQAHDLDGDARGNTLDSTRMFGRFLCPPGFVCSENALPESASSGQEEGEGMG